MIKIQSNVETFGLHALAGFNNNIYFDLEYQQKELPEKLLENKVCLIAQRTLNWWHEFCHIITKN
jgi:hypothetical protein